ncbi:MAG: Crp/Fnr family transcription regulator [Mucilaginibacter sp.]|nr:Crp/Fnr family transcription regulator [Mucilaginibacter sp.]
MMKDNLIRFIQQVLPMSPDSAEQVVAKFNPMKIEKNNYILKAGTVCNASHFIEKGMVRSYTYDLQGNEVTTAFYPANTYTSDLLSFFKRTPAKEYIQAITNCETWYITYEDMQASFHAIPEFREFGRLNIVTQYSLLKERMLSNLQKTADQRYSDLIQSHPEILQHVPLKYIASYLGIADTSLSRIRKESVKK